MDLASVDRPPTATREECEASILGWDALQRGRSKGAKKKKGSLRRERV
jgi:hypothetical protein